MECRRSKVFHGFDRTCREIICLLLRFFALFCSSRVYNYKKYMLIKVIAARMKLSTRVGLSKPTAFVTSDLVAPFHKKILGILT